jgi:hypothetical protein
LKNFVRRLLPLFSIVILCGCAAPLLSALTGGSSASSSTTPVNAAASLSSNMTPPSMFDQVEESTRVALVNPTAFLNETGRLDLAVIHAQCKFHTPDPPFLVPSEIAQKGWVFNGRLNDSGHFREMQALEYRSFFGLGWPKQQINTWPVSMTTLSELPNWYLDQRMTMLAGAKLEKKEQDTLTRKYVSNSQKIEEAVARLMKTYNPEVQCIRNN